MSNDHGVYVGDSSVHSAEALRLQYKSFRLYGLVHCLVGLRPARHGLYTSVSARQSERKTVTCFQYLGLVRWGANSMWVRASGPPGRRIAFGYDPYREGAVPRRLLKATKGHCTPTAIKPYVTVPQELDFVHAGGRQDLTLPRAPKPAALSSRHSVKASR